MSGHSKWKTIKHQKGAADAKRGQLFTKLTRDLALAVRQGGGTDPEINYRLRLAIDKAKSNNMPTDTIDRAIKRAGGEGSEQESFEEIVYEGYSPGGAAIMLQAITSNRNRTASEVRATFLKGGASLGETGCVAWNFESKGIITLRLDPQQTEYVALVAIDAGAEDVKIDGSFVEVHTLPEDLEEVKNALEKEDCPVITADLAMVPKTILSLNATEAEQTLRLLDLLEDLPDAQKVYTNADFPDTVLEEYSSAG